MDLIWEPYGLVTPVTEWKFHPIRKWRFDYAWPYINGEVPKGGPIAVEIEGGIWVKGAHTRGKHFLSDCEKYNTATAMGWRVFRFTPQQLKKGEAQEFMKTVFSPPGN